MRGPDSSPHCAFCRGLSRGAPGSAFSRLSRCTIQYSDLVWLSKSVHFRLYDWKSSLAAIATQCKRSVTIHRAPRFIAQLCLSPRAREGDQEEGDEAPRSPIIWDSSLLQRRDLVAYRPGLWGFGGGSGAQTLSEPHTLWL